MEKTYQRHSVSPDREPKANSPVLRLYLGNNGPCSPYRQPVSFLRDQLQRNKRLEVEQGKYIGRMNVLRNRHTRPLSKNEYDRLMIKTHFREKEPVSKDIVLTRWPESEKHIPGGITFRPDSPKHDYDEEEFGNDYLKHQNDMVDFLGEEWDLQRERYTPSHLDTVVNMPTYSAVGAVNELADDGHDQFDRLVNDEDNQSLAYNVRTSVVPQGDMVFKNYWEVSDDEIKTFALSSAEVARVAIIRRKLASTLAQVRGKANHRKASPNQDGTPSFKSEPLHHFSPLLSKPIKDTLNYDLMLTSDTNQNNANQLSYDPCQQKMFEYAAVPISNDYPSEFQHQHPLFPISAAAVAEGEQASSYKSPEKLYSTAIPERRMSPMELKRFRLQNGPFDVENDFSHRVGKTFHQPHPEIRGQFLISETNRRFKVSDISNNINSQSTFASGGAGIHAPLLQSICQDEDSTHGENQLISSEDITVKENRTNKQFDGDNIDTGLKKQSNLVNIPSIHDEKKEVNTNVLLQDEFKQNDHGIGKPLSFLGELKAKLGKSNLKAVNLEKISNQSSTSTTTATERQQAFVKQQKDRFQKFRHNMLMHNISEYSTERFQKEILLGRGKFAAVYAVNKQQPIRITTKDLSVEGIDMADDFQFQIDITTLKTIFRCLDTDEDPPDRSPNKIMGALKIAQYNGADNIDSLPPVSVTDEFERELIALKDLQSHPNIVGLVGYLSQPLSVVMELVEGENLYNCLHNIDWQCKKPMSSRLSLAIDIVRGLAFMHEKCYLHRDIKPHNILVDAHSGLAKIADLGTAVKIPFGPNASVSGNILLCDAVGTSGYTAPEILNPSGSSYYFPADVFSAAVVLWEIFFLIEKVEDFVSRTNPLCGNPNDSYQKIINGVRPKFNEDNRICDDIRSCINSGWATDVSARIKMSDFKSKLENCKLN